MCLIAFALNARPDCPLLIAANRDEFWDRPTLPLHSWTTPDGAVIHSGRDERAGGTWLGFNNGGRVAMLTNVRRTELLDRPRSRGELATRWLQGSTLCPDWQDLIGQVQPSDYAGFNLVLGDQHDGVWIWLSNHPVDAHAQGSPLPLPSGWVGRRLTPGFYGLSNAGLDTPWPKTQRLKAAVEHAVSQSPCSPVAAEGLLDVLRDRTAYGSEPEPDLAAPFVHVPAKGYGTRSSLIACQRVMPEGFALEISEWTYPQGQASQGAIHKRISISTWGMPTSR